MLLHFKKLLSSKFLSKSSKLTSLTILLVLYCSETWNLSKNTIKASYAFENKILIKIYGPFQKNKNKEDFKEKRGRYKDPDNIAKSRSRIIC